MSEYYKPSEDSRGTSYHSVDHTGHNLVPATEEEIRNSNLTPCKNCIKFHKLVPVEPIQNREFQTWSAEHTDNQL